MQNPIFNIAYLGKKIYLIFDIKPYQKTTSLKNKKFTVKEMKGTPIITKKELKRWFVQCKLYEKYSGIFLRYKNNIELVNIKKEEK